MMKKRIVSILLALLCLMPLLSSAGQAEHFGSLRVKCFKIGKADAYFIRTDQHSLMIDAGEDDDGQELIDYVKKREIEEIDYLIISHFDKRNIGGAEEFLGSIKAKQILVPDYTKDNLRTKMLFEAMADMQVSRVTQVTRFTLDGVDFVIYPAKSDFYEDDDDNDFSLVVSVTHGENKLLFPGDIMEMRITEMIEAGELTPHTFIKMPAHGQNIPGLSELLDAVRPEIALIPCSKKNPPAGAVTADLDARGIRWYATKDGAVSLTSDGYALTAKQTMKVKDDAEE